MNSLNEARRVLRPSPVRINHVPYWLWRHLQQRLEASRGLSAFSLLQIAAERTKTQHAFDHLGSTTIADRLVLVSEPYMSIETMLAGRRFAEFYDLEFDYFANSWWRPGETIRLAFSPKHPSK